MNYLRVTALLFGQFLTCTCIETVTMSSFRAQQLAATNLSNSYGVALTTAKAVQELDMPKPNFGSRRNNGISVQHVSKVPQDLFGSRRRSNRKVMWEWDYWCQIQPKTGKCHNAERSRTSFYYDIQLAECVPFNYSGCRGNENNFASKLKCEQHCQGSAFMPFKTIGIQSSCLLQPHSGVCLSLLSRYYYDVNSGSCKRFLYGGCGGNDNRFYTKKYCLNACRGTGVGLRNNIPVEMRPSPSVARVTVFGSENYEPSDDISA